MALSKEEKLNRVHQEALTEFNRVQSALRAERLQCVQDRRFYSIAGAQWEGALSDQYENRPKFEINKVHLAVIRIFNEYRNNRITVDFVAKDGAKNDKLADTCDDLYRACEQDSTADEAYDNAFEEGVGGGFGAWRLHAEYEDEYDPDNEQQKIKIAPIFDADTSVFFDLDAKRQDKADAKKCWVIYSQDKNSFIDEWGVDPATWPKDTDTNQFDWYTPDVVYVAEYYVVETKKEVRQVWVSPLGEEETHTEDEFEDDETLLETLQATGWKKVSERKIKCRKVHKYLMSGGAILEDCGLIPGQCIPIVPYYGKRWFVDNVERCMGHVRLCKDAQRLSNMMRTSLAEIMTFSPIEKPIFTAEQVAGWQVMWEEDNIKNYPYLIVNPIRDAQGQPMPSGPVGYTKPPAIPPALAALLQILDTDMKEILGGQEAGEEVMSNLSGKAVEMIQTRLDMQTFIYMSNMAKAIQRSGEIWLSMAKDVYVEKGRKVKGLSSSGEPRAIELQQPYMEKDGAETLRNDLKQAQYDVVAQVGPSSQSKRAAAVRALTGMMTVTQDPETLQVLSGMAMMNMEGEGISDAREFFRTKLLSMGAVKPTEEEAAQLAQAQANQPPNPQDIYLQSAAENEAAKAQKARADTILTIEKAQQTRADTIKTMVEIDKTEQEQALELIDRFSQPTTIQTPEVAAPQGEVTDYGQGGIE